MAQGPGSARRWLLTGAVVAALLAGGAACTSQGGAEAPPADGQPTSVPPSVECPPTNQAVPVDAGTVADPSVTFDPLPAGGTHVAAAVSPADVGPGQIRQTELRVYGCAAGDWAQVFATSLDTTDCEIVLTPVSVRGPDEQDLIFGRRCGSGGFLDFDVLGVTGPGGIEVLHSETALAAGQVTQDGDRLVVVTGSQERSLVWRDGRYAAQ